MFQPRQLKRNSPILEKSSFFGDCTWHLMARFLTFQKPKRSPNDFLVMFSSIYNLSKSGFGAISRFLLKWNDNKKAPKKYHFQPPERTLQPIFAIQRSSWAWSAHRFQATAAIKDDWAWWQFHSEQAGFFSLGWRAHRS